MGYSHALWSSSDEVDAAHWYSVCDTRINPFLDLRFIRTVEKSLGADGKYWCAVVYDEQQVPVACACYSLYHVDGSLLAPPAMQKAVDAVRRVAPWFFKFKILICGSPISTGQPQGQIQVAPHANAEQVVAALEEIASRLATQAGAFLISFKEFAPETTDLLKSLTQCGYRRADSVVTYTLKAEFPDFEAYYAARSKRTRANMRKAFQRFEEAGLRYVHIRGREQAEQLYTDAMHTLYENVFARAQVKFEKVPAEFFRELARQMPDEACFTYAYQGERPAGFVCAVTSGVYHNMLYCGVDYDINATGDVYFNLLYRALEPGFASGADYIKIGASADEFKQRMGCAATQLSFYIKAVGFLPSLIFNSIAGLLFR